MIKKVAKDLWPEENWVAHLSNNSTHIIMESYFHEVNSDDEHISWCVTQKSVEYAQKNVNTKFTLSNDDLAKIKTHVKSNTTDLQIVKIGKLNPNLKEPHSEIVTNEFTGEKKYKGFNCDNIGYFLSQEWVQINFQKTQYTF